MIYPLVAALNELDGLQAEIATTDADGPHGRLRASDLPGDIPIHLFRRTWSEQWKVSLRMRQWLRQHAKKYDLLHIHAAWSYATSTAARAADRAGVPYIIRPAGMLSEYSWNRRAWKKQVYWRLIEKRTMERATAFHATSEAEATELRATLPESRVFVIANGVDDAAFNWPREAATLKQRCGPAAGGQPIILHFSRLHPKKAIVERLLPAVAAMRHQCFLAIVGGDDPSAPGYGDEVRRAVDRLGLQRRVSLMGAVNGSERWAMYDGADVFVLPSHSENFGMVVAEAMVRGCPVVVTEGVQSSEYVRAAGAGEVVPPEVGTVADALDLVISDPTRRHDCGEAGRWYAAEHFRWGNIARRVRQMYVDCLTGDRVQS